MTTQACLLSLNNSVERLGVARTIGRNEYTAERATKQLADLINNPSYATRAKEVARKVQAEDG
jgi:UDP:flavonoid glycosyltransferase YjiC (YdhE family)